MARPKIGILTHFMQFDPAYALHVGWLERAKLLEYFGQDFEVLVDQRCKPDLYPNQKAVLKGIKSSKPFDERVVHFMRQYMELLPKYDVVLTADILYQTKANHLAYNAGLREAQLLVDDTRIKEFKDPVRYYHWIHSGWTTRPHVLHYPDDLKYKSMPNSKIIYLNSIELNDVATMYETDGKGVYSVYNPKDFRSFNNFHERSWEICRLLDIPNKEVIQIFPHCATRMESKGIMAVIRTFAAIKRAGLSVAIIFAQGNSRKMQAEIARLKDTMRLRYNLIDGEDYLFTCDIMDNYKALPRQAVSDLYKVANLFVFGSWRETVGNCFQEAKISGNLMVVNRGLPVMHEMNRVNDVVFFATDYSTPGVRDGAWGNLQQVNYGENGEEEDKYFNELAAEILPRLQSRKHLWQFSYDWIWENQLRPLLYAEVE